ncbi:MAG: hypothetical protein QXG03_12335 [Halalkalicoccus sp.]
MVRESDGADSSRRTVLKTLAAAGLIGTGVAGASGSAAAQQGGQGGGGFRRLSFDVEREGEIVEATDAVSRFDVGDDATFEGDLVFTDLDVNEDGELVASGRLRGQLSGNPTEQINETFDGLVLGLLEDVLDVLSPENAGECPILELVIEPIFLDLLGLQVETETIELDIRAIAGEGNLLGNLLCAVAGLLDP